MTCSMPVSVGDYMFQVHSPAAGQAQSVKCEARSKKKARMIADVYVTKRHDQCVNYLEMQRPRA